MATQTLLTVEQFAALPDDGLKHELDEGELLSMPPSQLRHGRCLVKLAHLLLGFVESNSLGLVAADAGFQLSGDTLRAPDIAFIGKERAATLDIEGRPHGAPDLAVEIVSPSDTASDLLRKVRQYLQAGARSVWVVYPEEREVHIHQAGGIRILRDADTLSEPDLLPGFSTPVNAIFG